MTSRAHPHAVLQVGHVLDVLRALPADSVHCVVTSPPYWGLRDYGLTPSIWGGAPDCEHAFELIEKRSKGYKQESRRRWQHTSEGYEGRRSEVPENWQPVGHGDICRRCGAWRGALGLEPTPELYVAHLTLVFDELRRILRKDGTVWLNIGDSYAQGGTGGCSPKSRLQGYTGPHTKLGQMQEKGVRHELPPGLKPKDMVGVPWRIALALQDRGWWLRADIIWDKPNPMPESVTDRPTLAHEHIFLLTKSRQYFYDWVAIAEEGKSSESDTKKMLEGGDRYGGKSLVDNDPRHKASNLSKIGKKRAVGLPGVRNARSVWTMATVPYPGAHFATFPPDLPARCIGAGTSEHGSCATCGAPYVRTVLRSPDFSGYPNGKGGTKNLRGLKAADPPRFAVQTTGWKRTCKCRTKERHPCVVLDPFGGSGTTSAIAVGMGRVAIYVDQSKEYAELARDRIGPLLCAEALP